MFRKNLALAIMSMFTPVRVAPSVDKLNDERIVPMHKTKGQKRNTASKSSGAAQLKRNAKTRDNINKRKGK
tara:strand:+ start:4321 stop:4533 length:213 start_codon:yes stop_codon:yes gene_type:complete